MSFRAARHVMAITLLAGTSLAQGTLFPVSYWYQAGDAPTGCTLADVDGNGSLDYVVANVHSDKVSVYLNTGSGLMNALPLLSVGGNLVQSVRVADMNNDTLADLVTANGGSDTVSVLLGNGAGGFAAPLVFPAGAWPSCVETGDMNGDGNLDVVVAAAGINSWAVLMGDGSGSLAAAIHNSVGVGTERIALADMNLDGKLDCVGADRGQDMTVIALGNGAGGLSVSASKFTSYPWGLAVGDISGDGKPDVVTASAQHDTLSVFLGNGSGGLGVGKTIWLQGADYPTSVMIADASGDGIPDLIACAAASKTLTVLIGEGAGAFGFAMTSPIQEQSYDSVAGDLNGDGFADVVTSHQVDDTIRVHMSAGVGSWERYCTAKVNSQGCLPRIFASGTPSVSNPRPFRVTVTDVLDHKAGLFLYTVNGTKASIPFQGGTLCIGPSGIRRTPAKNSNGDPKFPAPNCTGTYALDFNAFAQGLAGGNPDPGLLVLGNTYQVQCWSRDPGFAAPNNTGLTPALFVTPWL